MKHTQRVIFSTIAMIACNFLLARLAFEQASSIPTFLRFIANPIEPIVISVVVVLVSGAALLARYLVIRRDETEYIKLRDGGMDPREAIGHVIPQISGTEEFHAFVMKRVIEGDFSGSLEELVVDELSVTRLARLLHLAARDTSVTTSNRNAGGN